MNLNRLRSTRRSRDRYTRPRKIGFLWSSTTINWENQKWHSREAARSTRKTTLFCSSTARLSGWSGFIGPLSSSGTFASPVSPLQLPLWSPAPNRCQPRSCGCPRLGGVQSRQILVEARFQPCRRWRWVCAHERWLEHRILYYINHHLVTCVWIDIHNLNEPKSIIVNMLLYWIPSEFSMFIWSLLWFSAVVY